MKALIQSCAEFWAQVETGSSVRELKIALGIKAQRRITIGYPPLTIEANYFWGLGDPPCCCG